MSSSTSNNGLPRGTFTDVDEFVSAIPDISILPKKNYGPEATGCKISYLRYKGHPVRVQYGLDPTEPENANSTDILTTGFGISEPYDPENPRNGNKESNPPPGVPMGGWSSGSASDNPMAAAMNQQFINSSTSGDEGNSNGSNQNKKNVNRKTLDLKADESSKIYHSIYELEKHCIVFLKKNFEEYLGKDKISDDILDELCVPIMSVNKNDGTKFFNSKVDVSKAVIRMAKNDNTIVDIDWKEVKRGMNLTVMAEFTGIYYMKKGVNSKKTDIVKNFGFVINVIQVLAYEKQHDEQYSIQYNNSKYVYVNPRDTQPQSATASVTNTASNVSSGNSAAAAGSLKRKANEPPETSSSQNNHNPETFAINKRRRTENHNDDDSSDGNSSSNDEEDSQNRFVMPGATAESCPFPV